MNISIVSSSTRTGRISHRIALALQQDLEQRGQEVNLIDLAAINLPPFEERLSRLETAPAELTELNETLMATDAFIFLSPEYNGAISSGLKNFIDVFAKDPFMHKPIGVATGSTGSMGGIRAAYQLQQNILTCHGFPHPQMLTVGNMDKVIDPDGFIVDEPYRSKQSKFLDLFLVFADKLSRK
ncbi:NADPH-dependent FMN reductase [Croceimicrobium sp.]|uniref:NADPH-dependent FMN reductase n=1 Tax=Croceimicrobium sp. TaxID=2828340 RepID=UPI003BAC7FBA